MLDLWNKDLVECASSAYCNGLLYSVTTGEAVDTSQMAGIVDFK